MVDLASVHTEVTTEIAAAPLEVWAVITDLSLTPMVNRETVETVWVAPATGPAVGAVFRATNEMGEQRWTVDCHVVASDPGVAFEWTVLDPTHPSSMWWHRLEPLAGGGTVVHHGFRHGPNISGLRRRVEADPDGASRIIAFRTEMLRSNMAYTLDQYARLVERRT